MVALECIWDSRTTKIADAIGEQRATIERRRRNHNFAIITVH